MGFFSSAASFSFTGSRQPEQKPISEQEALFDDFEQTVARLKRFDLEADNSFEEENPRASSPVTVKGKHDVK